MVKGTNTKSKKSKPNKVVRHAALNPKGGGLEDPKKKAKRIYDAKRYLRTKEKQGFESPNAQSTAAENLARRESFSTKKKRNKATQTEACQVITPYPAVSTEHTPSDGQETAAPTATDIENSCNCQSNNCLECQSRDRDTLFDILQDIGSTLIVHSLPLKDRRKVLATPSNLLKGTQVEEMIYEMYIDASSRASRLLYQSWDLPPSSPPTDDDD